MYKRFFTAPEQSFFLFGPRGTGKTTWLKQHYEGQAFWLDLLEPVSFRYYSAGGERLEKILAERSEKIVVIDEIQRVPDLLNVVHRLIEAKRGYQFILTGSSARKLRSQGVNLLGGRALIRHMPPFFASELGNTFDLAKNLRLGMLPIVLDSASPEEVLKAYVGIYLKEEVQAEGIVRNVGDFSRFLETMSFSHASLINASNIARECQIARKTVDSYLQILEDLLLSFQLSVFRRKSKRALSAHSKFYFFDSGVYYSLCQEDIHDPGAALEGLVAQHLKGWIESQSETYQLHFWRTSTKLEVDFVLTGPDCFYAIEVKNGTVVHPKDLNSLETFAGDYPEAECVLLYRGKERFRERNVLCMPVDDFLQSLIPNQSIFNE